MTHSNKTVEGDWAGLRYIDTLIHGEWPAVRLIVGASRADMLSTPVAHTATATESHAEIHAIRSTAGADAVILIASSDRIRASEDLTRRVGKV